MQSSSSWQHHITLDLLLSVLHQTIFHPFIAFLLPLSLRALATPYSHPSFQLTSTYFLLLSLYHILFLVSTRFASNGPAREVDYDEGDEVVVITGGGSGLGECIAEIFGFRGVSVAVIDKRLGQWKPEGNTAATEGGVRGYECDVGDRNEVEKVWMRIAEDLGPPTILINNAAVVHGKQFLDLSVEEIENTFRTNTLSHYHLTYLFLRSILQRPSGGTLVTISSVLGHLGASHLSDYTGSKAALLAFHASLSAELSPYPNIKTILVTPGQLDSGMFAAVRLGGWTRRFFAPVVEVRELAVKLVAMIDSGEGGVLAMPAYARWIAWLAVLPVGLQKLLRSWSGVDDAMAEFTSPTVITPQRADEHLIPVKVDKKKRKYKSKKTL